MNESIRSWPPRRKAVRWLVEHLESIDVDEIEEILSRDPPNMPGAFRALVTNVSEAVFHLEPERRSRLVAYLQHNVWPRAVVKMGDPLTGKPNLKVLFLKHRKSLNLTKVWVAKMLCCREAANYAAVELLRRRPDSNCFRGASLFKIILERCSRIVRVRLEEMEELRRSSMPLLRKLIDEGRLSYGSLSGYLAVHKYHLGNLIGATTRPRKLRRQQEDLHTVFLIAKNGLAERLLAKFDPVPPGVVKRLLPSLEFIISEPDYFIAATTHGNPPSSLITETLQSFPFAESFAVMLPASACSTLFGIRPLADEMTLHGLGRNPGPYSTIASQIRSLSKIAGANQ